MRNVDRRFKVDVISELFRNVHFKALHRSISCAGCHLKEINCPVVEIRAYLQIEQLERYEKNPTI